MDIHRLFIKTIFFLDLNIHFYLEKLKQRLLNIFLFPPKKITLHDYSFRTNEV